MSDDIQQIERPTPRPQCSPEQILLGPSITPLDYIKLYSDADFEEFIREWAYFYLQELSHQYVKICRFGGAGDMGRDIVAYIDLAKQDCDIFQCKHYDHALHPGDIWPELAKLCYYTYGKRIPVPRKYVVLAPQDIGPELGRLLEDHIQLRSGLIAEWQNTTKKDSLAKKITKGSLIDLNGPLLAYVNAFDFSIVGHKPMLEIVAEHQKTIRYAPRFGGGLIKPCPPDKTPPDEIAPHESRYVEQLLEAYGDHLQDSTLDFAKLASQSALLAHFNRSRERYYCAETLREFARDTLPAAFTFENVQDQVHDAVIDTAEMPHASGYERVVETTKTAAAVHVTNHPLRSYLKPKSLMGICHQLANNDRLRWVP
jgi:hypothetical protein